MTEFWFIMLMVGLPVWPTSEPAPELGLEGPVTIVVRPSEPVELACPAASLLRVGGGDKMRFWWRTRGHEGQAADLLLVPTREPDGTQLVSTWPGADGFLLFEAAAEHDEQLTLVRLDSGVAISRSGNWTRLETQLLAWAREPTDAPLPSPPWASTSLEESLLELAVLAEVLLRTDTPIQEREALLREAAIREIERLRPLASPPYRGEAIALGGPTLAVDDPDDPFLETRSGERWTLQVPESGVLRIEVLQQRESECTRGWLQIGAWHPVTFDASCEAGPAVGIARVLQHPVTAQSRVELGVTSGGLLTRARLYRRLPSWESWLTPVRVVDLATRGIALGNPWARAEALRLTGDRQAAHQAYAELATVGQDAFLKAYAAWRSLSLSLDNGRAALQLAGLVSALPRDLAGADALVQLAAADAARQSLLAGSPDALRDMALEGHVPLAPALAAQLLSAVWLPGIRDLGLGLVISAWRSTPSRLDLGRSVTRALKNVGHWQTLPFDSVEPVYTLEPTPPVTPLVDSTEPPLTLVTVRPTGDTLDVPEDPLGLGRLLRVPIAVRVSIDGPALAEVQVDDLRLTVPLDRPLVRTSVALAAGPHHVQTSEGVTLFAPAIREPGLRPLLELRRYWPLAIEPLSATLPSEPALSVATVGVMLDAPKDGAVPQPVELEICVDDECRRARVWPPTLPTTRGAREGATPATLTIEIPGNSSSFRVRRLSLGAAAWVRVSLRARQPLQGTPAMSDWRPLVLPADLPARLAELGAAVGREPGNSALLIARAKLALLSGDILTARADLTQASWTRSEAAGLLASLGPPGMWVQSPPLDPNTPPARVLRLEAEHALGAVDDPEGDLRRALVTLRRGELAAGVAELQALVAHGGPTAALATTVLARQIAIPEPAHAAELLANLAPKEPRAASLLRAEAARLRLPASEEAPWRLAYAEAVAAGPTPGALTVRGAVAQQSEWQPIPIVDTSAGQVWLLQIKPMGPLLGETLPAGSAPDLAAPLALRMHLTTHLRPVVVHLLGPSVLRVAGRALLRKEVATDLSVAIDHRPVASLDLPQVVDETLVLTHGLEGGVTQPAVVLVPILESGMHEIEIRPAQGLVSLALAVRAHQAEKPVTPFPLGAELVPTTPPPGTKFLRSPMVRTTAPRLAELSALTPPVPLLPWTTVATLSAEQRNRDDEADHALNEPMLPLTLTAHRRLANRVWVAAGPEIAVRPHAAATYGLGARLDVGQGPGPRLTLSGEGYAQRLTQTWTSSRRLAADGGWELALAPNLDVRAMAGVFLRQLSRDTTPRQHRAVDPLVYSAYTSEHLRGADALGLLSYRPATDLLAQASLRAVSNTDFGTFDYYRWGLTLWGASPPFYVRLGLEHEHRLADSDRFVAYDRERLSARLGFSAWLAAGHRVRTEVTQLWSIQDRRYELGLAVSYELSAGRGMTDIAPSDPFRQVWADLEPEPHGMEP